MDQQRYKDWDEVPLILTIEDFMNLYPGTKSRQTVVKYINEGKLKGFKEGNQYHILKEDAYRFLHGGKSMEDAAAEQVSVYNADGHYKWNKNFSQPKIAVPNGTVQVMYHNPDAVSGDQFVLLEMPEEKYDELWHFLFNNEYRPERIPKETFEEFSDTFDGLAKCYLFDANENPEGYEYIKNFWLQAEKRDFDIKNAAWAAKFINDTKRANELNYAGMAM